LSGRLQSDNSLPNAVAAELRSLIVRGALLPGEHLGQTQLAERFGRSKVPIREALKLLSSEGFLRHDRNRGYFVEKLDLAEARQLYKLRRWLEADLLETARWPEPEEIAELRKQFDDLSKDFKVWADVLEKLRYSIFDLSPQKVLLREALRLWKLTDRYRALMPREEGESLERTLIDAFEAKDRERLVSDYIAVRDQVESVLEQELLDAAS
jgi:DNA-binding GntR family transcriptional regulator